MTGQFNIKFNKINHLYFKILEIIGQYGKNKDNDRRKEGSKEAAISDEEGSRRKERVDSKV